MAPPILAAAIALGTAAFGSLGLLLAGALRAEATLALANALFVLFLLIGGVILPLDRLPAPLAAVAEALPAAALTNALRVGFGSGGDALLPLGILGAWAVGAGLLTARTFRWE
jgi:ABC-2 type transport system permease protein